MLIEHHGLSLPALLVLYNEVFNFTVILGVKSSEQLLNVLSSIFRHKVWVQSFAHVDTVGSLILRKPRLLLLRLNIALPRILSFASFRAERSTDIIVGSRSKQGGSRQELTILLSRFNQTRVELFSFVSDSQVHALCLHESRANLSIHLFKNYLT